MLQVFAKKKGLALKNLKGFTLIELLVVIAIIGVLASIVLVSMGGARQSARNAVRKADMRQLISAQELYYGNCDKYYALATYPTSVVSGAECTGGTSGVTYMASTPKDPSTGAGYGVLSNAADSTKFCYYATLEGTTVTYYTASHGGNVTKTAVPTTLDNCATP